MRDSGVVHALLRLDDREAALGHPVAGGSWEGFVLENLLCAAPGRTEASFYRTAAGAEIDLVLDLPGGARWAVEIERGLTPTLGKGFYRARDDVKPDRVFVVYSGDERYPMAEGVEAVGLTEMTAHLAEAR